MSNDQKIFYANLAYFKGEVYLHFAKYGNGRIAIKLLYPSHHEPIAIASVNMPEIDLLSDEFICKGYSENLGMEDFMVENGIASDTGKIADNGFVCCRILKLTQQLLNLNHND